MQIITQKNISKILWVLNDIQATRELSSSTKCKEVVFEFKVKNEKNEPSMQEKRNIIKKLTENSILWVMRDFNRYDHITDKKTGKLVKFAEGAPLDIASRKGIIQPSSSRLRINIDKFEKYFNLLTNSVSIDTIYTEGYKPGDYKDPAFTLEGRSRKKTKVQSEQNNKIVDYKFDSTKSKGILRIKGKEINYEDKRSWIINLFFEKSDTNSAYDFEDFKEYYLNDDSKEITSDFFNKAIAGINRRVNDESPNLRSIIEIANPEQHNKRRIFRWKIEKK